MTARTCLHQGNVYEFWPQHTRSLTRQRTLYDYGSSNRISFCCRQTSFYEQSVGQSCTLFSYYCTEIRWQWCVCVRIGVRRSLSTELFNSRWRKTGRTDGRTEFDWPMTRRLCSGWTVHHVLRMTPVVAKIWVVLTIGMELAFDEGVDASKGASSLKSGESIEILIFLVSFKRSTCNFNKMQRKAGLT